MEDDRWKKGQGRDGNSFSARQDGQAMKEDTNCNRWRGDGKRWEERQGGDGNSISARQDMSTNMIWKKTLNTTDGRRKQKKNHYVDKTQSNSASSVPTSAAALNGRILRSWSPAVPEVAQLPVAKIVIFPLKLNGATRHKSKKLDQKRGPQIMIPQHGRCLPIFHWASYSL